MNSTFISIASIITALGGVEFIKFLSNRHQQRKSAEIEAAHREFSLIRESITFLQEEMNKNHVEIARLQDKVLELTREKAIIEAELQLKRCEQRGCPNRQPQNGY